MNDVSRYSTGTVQFHRNGPKRTLGMRNGGFDGSLSGRCGRLGAPGIGGLPCLIWRGGVVGASGKVILCVAEEKESDKCVDNGTRSIFFNDPLSMEHVFLCRRWNIRSLYRTHTFLPKVGHVTMMSLNFFFIHSKTTYGVFVDGTCVPVSSFRWHILRFYTIFMDYDDDVKLFSVVRHPSSTEHMFLGVEKVGCQCHWLIVHNDDDVSSWFIFELMEHVFHVSDLKN